MRTLRHALFLGLALAICGCEGGPVETVPFKETNPDQFNEMKQHMINDLKTKAYQKKPQVPPASAPAGKTP